MKRDSSLGGVVFVALLIGSSVPYASAQLPGNGGPPDIVHSYRLIPTHSTLEQAGGFAGFHFDYTLFGKFEVRTGYENGVSCLAIGCPPPPTNIPFARFEDVHVFAFNNDPRVDAFPLPLSRFVDLEKLRGTFRPDEPRSLIFHGQDNQGAPFDLLAVQRGPLLHMLGENRPPCCDFFHYKIDALAHIAPYADFNFDGVVDRADSDRLLANIGKLSDASLEDGDADGDGDVDGNDFLTWQSQLGPSVSLSEFAGDSLADFSLTTITVPEPATAATVLLGAVAMLFARRFRRNLTRRDDSDLVVLAA